MEKKKAKLLTLRHSGDARILREIEGSDETYVPGREESQRSVIITQASTSLLKKELAEIGLVIDDVATIERVAKKFAKELVRKPNGKLALDESFGLGLCEIIS